MPTAQQYRLPDPHTILWRKIKYDWLQMSSYTRYDHLKKAVMQTLIGFG